VVLPKRNNFPPKNFILPESETETFCEHRNSPAAHGAAMMHPAVQHLSHSGALAALGTFQMSKPRSHDYFPWLSSTSKELETKAWRRNK